MVDTSNWHTPSRRQWEPSDNGLIGCSFAPHETKAGAAAATSFYWLQRVFIPAGKKITNLHTYVSVAGAGLTDAAMAVYEQSGTKVGETGSLVTAFQSTGSKSAPLGTPIAAESYDRNVWVGILAAGTTSPTVAIVDGLAAYSLISAFNLPAVGRQNAGYIFGAAPFPATLDLTIMTGYFNFWVGVS